MVFLKQIGVRSYNILLFPLSHMNVKHLTSGGKSCMHLCMFMQVIKKCLPLASTERLHRLVGLLYYWYLGHVML